MRIIMTLTVSLLLGVILQLFLLPENIGFLIGAVLVLVGFVLFLAARRKCLRLVLIAYGLAVGLLWAGGYEYLKVEPVLSLAGKECEITAEATNYSVMDDSGNIVDIRTTISGYTFKSKLYYDDPIAINPGDQLKVTVYFRDSAAYGSYYDYGESLFVTALQQGEIFVSSPEKVPFRYIPQVIARQLEESIIAAFPEDVWGYAVALTTGARGYLSDGEVYDLRMSGCYHALALSGMHLVILAALFFGNTKKKWLKVLLAVPVCGVFTVITGLTPSMVRAFVMLLFGYLAPLSKREPDSLTNLSLSALVLILQCPWCIASWGLQLSFVSTLGIILFGKRMLYRITAVTKVNRGMTIRYYILNSLSLTLSALVFTVPLQMIHFGYISIVASITNILTSFAIEVCFPGSLIVAIIGLVSQPFGQALGWILAWAFRYVKLVMALFADLPFAAVFTDISYVVIWLILCYGVIFTMALWPKERKIIPVCSMLSTLAVLLLLTTLDSAGFTFTALDVGQGQCLVLRSGGGTVMVDCGGRKSGEIAADYLGSIGESGVDLLIVTHYDNDHIGGIADLMERKSVEKLMLPDTASEKRQEVLSLALAHNTEVYFCRQDHSVYCGGTEIKVFAPVGSGESNESGLSILATGKKMDVLITGDMEMGTELLLLKTHELPDVDVLVAGHHGSRDSTSEILLEQVKPEIVVVSVGDNNYGHPHEETLDRIHKANAEIYRTDQQGNIKLKEAS